MGGFSLIHWIILGVIILLLFGGNRFSAMMSDVAKGLKSFKQGLSEEDKPEERREERRNEPPRSLPRETDQRDPIDVTPSRPSEPATPPNDERRGS